MLQWSSQKKKVVSNFQSLRERKYVTEPHRCLTENDVTKSCTMGDLVLLLFATRCCSTWLTNTSPPAHATALIFPFCPGSFWKVLRCLHDETPFSDTCNRSHHCWFSLKSSCYAHSQCKERIVSSKCCQLGKIGLDMVSIQFWIDPGSATSWHLLSQTS